MHLIAKQVLKSISRQNNYRNFKSNSPFPLLLPHNYRKFNSNSNSDLLHHQQQQEENPCREQAIRIQTTLKTYRDGPLRKIEIALLQYKAILTENLVLEVLRRFRSDWKPAYIFFNWALQNHEIGTGSLAFNEILDVLGRMRRFDELTKVFDEMSKRGGLVNEETYRVLVNRYASAGLVDDALALFHKRRELGLELDDSRSFQMLLRHLCRYKNVELAESLLLSKGREFGCLDTKTMNIVLNGWCVLGNVYEAKRFWKDILALRKCKPDRFTYATFIKALTQKGKLGTALRLYRGMWDKGYNPDVVICNCMIDALCFKKRIPEALGIFNEMRERGCLPNAATYNSLIKYMCKIKRMEKVYELLNEMEEKNGDCAPNNVTFSYLLKSLKKPEDIDNVLKRMEKNQCEMSSDLYNLILRLYINWNCEDKVRETWNLMEKDGMGPDRRSYTIMIHGLERKGKIEEALCYYGEMTSKGIKPEPRTEILVSGMKTKVKGGGDEDGKNMVKNEK